MVGQVFTQILSAFRYESTYKIETSEGLIVSKPYKRDETIFIGVGAREKILLIELFGVICHQRTEFTHLF
jgi:hypothetical protein